MFSKALFALVAALLQASPSFSATNVCNAPGGAAYIPCAAGPGSGNGNPPMEVGCCEIKELDGETAKFMFTGDVDSDNHWTMRVLDVSGIVIIKKFDCAPDGSCKWLRLTPAVTTPLDVHVHRTGFSINANGGYIRVQFLCASCEGAPDCEADLGGVCANENTPDCRENGILGDYCSGNKKCCKKIDNPDSCEEDGGVCDTANSEACRNGEVIGNCGGGMKCCREGSSTCDGLGDGRRTICANEHSRHCRDDVILGDCPEIPGNVKCCYHHNFS